MAYIPNIASYPVPISIPTSAREGTRAEIKMEIGTGYEAIPNSACLAVDSLSKLSFSNLIQ